MNKKNLQIIILIFLLVVLALYGIYQLKDVQTLTQKENKIPPKPTSSFEPQKKVQVESLPKVYSYEAYNVRDPFYPQIIRKETVKGASPLENYDIEELKLTGILKDNKGYKGLIKTPDGRYFVVRERDKVGLHGGQITRIFKDGIEIKEVVRAYTGEFLQTTKTLKLRTEEGL